MDLTGLFSKRCVLVTGKGGVGRSTVTAALALAAARRGRRVLVSEVGDEGQGHSPLARHFGRERLPEVRPAPLAPGVEAVELLARVGQELFLATVLHAATLAHAAMSSEALRRMVNAGPSFREMGVYFQLLTLLRARRPEGDPLHELILVDMPATGHTLSLTGLPELLLRLVPRGPIAEALREGQGYMNDPAQAAAWTVTLPETLPVSECLELLDGLRRTAMPAGGVFVNRIPRDPFTAAEREGLAALIARHRLLGAEGFHRLEGCACELRRLQAGTALPVIGLPELEGGPSLATDLSLALEGADPVEELLAVPRPARGAAPAAGSLLA
ncbi:MAG TPA: arsenic transporter [Myxococcales bacterium]|nr:arsenic transporter [Myxococcales bacterium]